MPSIVSLPSRAFAIAFLTASTAMARALRAELRLYSVSPIPTMQYLSLSDPMGLLATRSLPFPDPGVSLPLVVHLELEEEFTKHCSILLCASAREPCAGVSVLGRGTSTVDRPCA